MKLLTKNLEERFAQIGSQADEANPLVVVRFFNACSSAWYATEYDPKTRMFFGYVAILGHNSGKWESFSLDELEAFRGPFGIEIERDEYSKNHRASDLRIVRK